MLRLRGGIIEPSLKLLAEKTNQNKVICRKYVPRFHHASDAPARPPDRPTHLAAASHARAALPPRRRLLREACRRGMQKI